MARKPVIKGTVSVADTPSFEELEVAFASSRELHHLVQGAKLAPILVPLVFGFLVWREQTLFPPAFLWLVAGFLGVSSVVSLMIPRRMATRWSKMDKPWEYVASAREISFRVGRAVHTLEWRQISSFDEGDHWIWIYPKQGVGIAVLKRLFQADDLEAMRAYLAHASPGAAWKRLRKKYARLGLWVLVIAAALAYYQLVQGGSG